MDHQHRALVAMSGGVDSTVAAHLTLRSGVECIGATLRLYTESDTACGSIQDALDAHAIANRLGMDFQVIDASEAFTHQVMNKFVRCYLEGLTPSPCIDCNRYMKFGQLLEYALSQGCDQLVTGHYAQILYDEASGRYLLKKAVDTGKDQSYFLCMLTQHQLAHTRFPLGGMTKTDVRQIAQEQGFLNARKRDSQDICFIPDGNHRKYLERFHPFAPGDFLDLEGNVVGRHTGAVGYTCGQRKGLGLAMGVPVYVCATDAMQNTVTVGPNEALFRQSLRANDWNFFPFARLTAPLRVSAKVRSRMTEQPATVYPQEDGSCIVTFDQPQRAITPGQAVVLYDGDLVIGGGTITQVL